MSDIYYIGTSEINIQLVGLLVIFVLIYLAFKLDEMSEKKVMWKPIMIFINVPIALSLGISYLGETRFSVGWWIGITMFCFAIVLSLAGSYYSLHFGESDK